MTMARNEYEQRMDALATAISNVVDGQYLPDVAIACAAVIGTALSEMPRDARARARELVIQMIDMRANENDAHTTH